MSNKKSKITSYLTQWHLGNEDSLNELLKRHLPWLSRKIHRLMGPALRKKGETQDYLQDAMIQFLKDIPSFTISDEAQFRALLLQIAKNTMHNKYDWFTRKRRDMAKERPIAPDTVLNLDPPRNKVRTPSMSADRMEREAWVRFGMELLDPPSREILILHQWEKIPFTEIGKRFGITQEAARMRHNRAALKLSEAVWAMRRGELDQFLDSGEEHDEE